MEEAKIPNENRRLYVIGDIHGRLDLLERMIEAINRDAEEHGGSALRSRSATISTAARSPAACLIGCWKTHFQATYVALKGNHEVLLEAFLADPKAGVHWQHLGGLETLHSFGVRVGRLIGGRNFDQAAEQLRAALSPEQMEFLGIAENVADVRPLLLVPRRRAARRSAGQARATMICCGSATSFSTASGFRQDRRAWAHAAWEPQVLPNRINIDTGAFATGRLTCVVLEDGAHRFITA